MMRANESTVSVLDAASASIPDDLGSSHSERDILRNCLPPV